MSQRYLSLTPSPAPVVFGDVDSILFDGTSGYTAVNSSTSYDFEYTDPFWMGCWIFVHDVHPSTDFGKEEIIGKVLPSTDGTAPHRGYHGRFTQDLTGYNQRLCFYLVNQAAGGMNNYMGVTTDDFIIPLNTWARVDFVNTDGTAANAKIYVNGVSQTLNVEADNLSATIKNNAKFGLASRNGVEDFFNGRINDPMIADFVPTQGDINLLALSTAPTNAAAQIFSGGSALGAWWNGDSDPVLKTLDRIGKIHMYLHGGASFLSNVQSTIPTPDPTWTPLQAITDGTVKRYIDAKVASSYTESGGVVSEVRDVNTAEAYAQATSLLRPTLSTIGGSLAFDSDGTQFLTLSVPARLLTVTDRFLLFFVANPDSYAGFPALMGDGDNITQTNKIGFSDQATYTDFYFGQDASGGNFAPVRWPFGGGAPVRATIFYERGNLVGSYTAHFNGGTTAATTTGGFAPEVDAGALFALGITNIMDGQIGGIGIIINPSAQDIANATYWVTNF